MSTPGLKTDRFPGICRVSQYRDSTALSAHHHGEQISKRSFRPVSARPQAWPLSLDYVMSEIGRDHFLVATYEHMSLNATPTTRVVPHLSSGIVERAKRERTWKSPHARKGDTRRGERKIIFSLPKKQLCRSITLFSTFLWRPLHDYDLKPPNLTFYEGRGHTTSNFPSSIWTWIKSSRL